ncbi:hypothetical protein FA15DRAFT_664520 [Coprinopsis marcescibilis]|uniref:Uncharacterized protein n=1 Tax=Coprinopsis marcescibilis TaxID=230819 RepID=A0A5C3LAZ5_COPMA|nr:hypothetical protein FA15DRAFT_664520 [Coprinopsis marcescibilis]
MTSKGQAASAPSTPVRRKPFRTHKTPLTAPSGQRPSHKRHKQISSGRTGSSQRCLFESTPSSGPHLFDNFGGYPEISIRKRAPQSGEARLQQRVREPKPKSERTALKRVPSSTPTPSASINFIPPSSPPHIQPDTSNASGSQLLDSHWTLQQMQGQTPIPWVATPGSSFKLSLTPQAGSSNLPPLTPLSRLKALNQFPTSYGSTLQTFHNFTKPAFKSSLNPHGGSTFDGNPFKVDVYEVHHGSSPLRVHCYRTIVETWALRIPCHATNTLEFWSDLFLTVCSQPQRTEELTTLEQVIGEVMLFFSQARRTSGPFTTPTPPHPSEKKFCFLVTHITDLRLRRVEEEAATQETPLIFQQQAESLQFQQPPNTWLSVAAAHFYPTTPPGAYMDENWEMEAQFTYVLPDVEQYHQGHSPPRLDIDMHALLEWTL